MSKKMKLKVSVSVLAVAGLAMQSGSAHAAGFEKSLSWSAATAAQGGAVVGSVKGADSLYYNPAGLAGAGSTSTEISLNISPTFSKFEGANPYQNKGTVAGESGFSPVAGALASYKLNNQLAFGLGYYVSGGTKSKYEKLDYSNSSVNSNAALNNFSGLMPNVETSLAITEAALGFGYEIIPGLRVGAAWRIVSVNADFETVMSQALPNPAPPGSYGLASLRIADISKTKFDGYKLGAQYDSTDKSWGLGVSYRSKVEFTAEGDVSGRLQLPVALGGTSTDLGKGRASITNIFPQQLNLGGYVKASDSLRVSLEYSFTNYSKNKSLPVVGNLGTTGLNREIAQAWKNQHIGRIGFEYTGCSMPIRFGYALTSQVTPSDRARSTFASPGKGHAIALGTGMPVMTNLDMDVAGEYSFASGTGHNNAANPPEVANDADFKSHAFVAHLSAKYHF